MSGTQTRPRLLGIDDGTLERYAELIVAFAANVQPGQVVELRSAIGREPLTRAVADACYRHGARFVDLLYDDPHVKRSRVRHAAEESLDFVPSWHRDRVLGYGRERAARVAIGGLTDPGLLDDLDPRRVAKHRWPFIPEYHTIIDEGTTNWVGANTPTADWAATVFPDLDADEAVARLWEAVVYCCRLDEPDAAAAWRARLGERERTKAALAALRLDALHFEGPGTDLTVGLLPTSSWDGGLSDTVSGIRYLANLPTEELFTGPDPERTEGVVRSTRPLVLRSGAVIKGLRVRFERGRAVEIDAERNAETIRAECARDDGAARLGEVALVDRESRVGQTGLVFYDTLYDENAASHVAFGSAYLDTAGEEDRPRLNRSVVHVDFMIGGEDVQVTGVTRDGARVELLRGGAWQI